MAEFPPSIVVIAGPNGAGKSTAAPALLADVLGITNFINADTIALGLSAFSPEKAAIQAGRIMLGRLKELAAARESFAFETTLASRSFAPWIEELCSGGYQFHLLFLYLPTAEAAYDRVKERVRTGGHSVPEEVVRRRYAAGIRNFFHLYQRLATTWRFYDNTYRTGPRPIAAGRFLNEQVIYDPNAWQSIKAVK